MFLCNHASLNSKPVTYHSKLKPISLGYLINNECLCIGGVAGVNSGLIFQLQNCKANPVATSSSFLNYNRYFQLVGSKILQ